MSKQVSLLSISRDWLSMAERYRPNAFWFWNAEMTPAGIEASLDEMAAKGLREILIHPSHGLTVEYLSEEYFNLLRLALAAARKRGLKIWIYDEYAWPSGTAGGRLLTEYPDYCGWILVFHRDEHGTISARPVRQDRVLDSAVASPWSTSVPGYLDTLRREAVGQFIKMTYQRVYEECREYFSDVIIGFFTDEPVMMIGTVTENYGMWDVPSVPWTPEIPKMFQERFGYDIVPQYAELAMGSDSQVKRDYWDLLKGLHAETYHGQIADWCREHGVLYTGHLFSEDYLLNHTRFSGSVFQCLRRMDIPGIDYLGVGRRPEDRFWEHVLVASIARHAGRSRVFCEAYNLLPMDTRLSDMLYLAQFFGIHGIDDIALMAFRQGSDGIRKRCQWPTLFTDAPWWDFYELYRDAVARSLALTSLGTRKARYALLYPQEQLEQTDAFYSCTALTDPGSKMICEAGLRVYAAGETFDFVFPEILGEASVNGDSIAFPHAVYDAILAPSDVQYSEADKEYLQRLRQAGGTIIENLDALKSVEPSWRKTISVQISPDPNACRIYQYEYPDGVMYAIHNVTPNQAVLNVSSQDEITEWDPLTGRCIHRDRGHEWSLSAYRTVYISISNTPIASSDTKTEEMPLAAEWTITTERPNMSYLSNLQFQHPQKGWMDPGPWGYACFYRQESDRRYVTTIPTAFAGMTHIPMRAEITLRDTPSSIGILYEKEHLETLSINGISIQLGDSISIPVWDSSCRYIDISSAVRVGYNTVNGTLRYADWEVNHLGKGFVVLETSMPTCDVRLAGDYRFLNEDIVCDKHLPMSLPLELGEAGYSQYSGIAVLTATLNVPDDSVIGLVVDPIREDAVEVLLDGVSMGRCIARPYRFLSTGIPLGRHEVQIRIAGTSANIMDEPVPWGIRSVGWIVRK